MNLHFLNTETGYYPESFASFRYYNPALSQWLSTDPLAEKYPGISPYTYTADNPVMLTDRDGREPDDPPLTIMKVRRNRASNLGPGYVRNNGKRFHAGHDLYAPVGTPVHSVLKGKIIKVGHSKSYGKYITIQHKIKKEILFIAKDGSEYRYQVNIITYSFYAHLSETKVKEGQNVEAGNIIGKTGTTGNAFSGKGGLDEHLHFEYGTSLRKGGSMMLARSGLLNPNEAYGTIEINSLNPKGNQTNTGVVIKQYDTSHNLITKTVYPKPNSDDYTKYYYSR